MATRKISLKKGRSCLSWVSQLMKPGLREWDEQIMATCLYAHDVKEVLKLRLPVRGGYDFVAWHYENN
jgi:hypothetical protein